MRFQVTQVMDAIEHRLTTDITGAQAVVDLGEVVRNAELDAGRPVNLVRIGMVVDALGRYLIDGGAMLYGVVERALLSEAALTSKERMVLSRWADDGLIEVTPVVGDRAVEVADLTGLPLIATAPDPALVTRFPWLAAGTGRVLRLVPRSGIAVLTPVLSSADEAAHGGIDDATDAEPAVGRARLPEPEPPTEAAPDQPAESAEAPDQPAGSAEAPDQPAGQPEPDPLPVPVPVEVFTGLGAVPAGRVRVSRRRYLRAEPNPDHASLLARRWRCLEPDCPVFGEHRQIGQPVPRLRDTTPVCPRHGEPVTDAGPRPPAYAVSIVVDDLPRRRLVVRHGQPISVGRAADDPDVVSVDAWLHQAAATWISPVHLRLEATDDGLVVTDLSVHGTVLWRRDGPDQPGSAQPLRRVAYPLGEWDSVELYTGIELVPGDHRPVSVLGQVEPVSVLLDAPTAAHRQVSAASPPSPPGAAPASRRSRKKATESVPESGALSRGRRGRAGAGVGVQPFVDGGEGVVEDA